MRIGKLVMNLAFQGKGIGAFLLKDAFLRAINISTEVALFCVIVDAIDEKAASFYTKYGFVPFQDYPYTLVLPLKTIIEAAED
jgi:GNAT superfamily N-acetyltransferase